MKPASKIDVLSEKTLPSAKPDLQKPDWGPAYKTCQSLVHEKLNYVRLCRWLIPQKYLPHLSALYAFVNRASQFSREESFEGNRMAKLKEWEIELEKMDYETPRQPVFIALKDTLQKFSIPRPLLSDLMTAFKMDVVVSRYATIDQILNYCRHSANPIGRIALHIIGYPAPKFLEYSDSLCTALQLTHFWRNIPIDLHKDRVYLPQEDLARFQYPESDLFARKTNENFRRLMFSQVERTKEFFEQGRFLCGKIPGRPGLILRQIWLGGMALLEKILENGDKALVRRTILGKKDLIKIACGALSKKNFG